MAQEKVRGDQIDVQDFTNELVNDTTAITSIATGIITDPGAIGVFNEEYIVNLVDIVVNASAVTDVFIYDTSLDDDGGAWIDKANKQSWYHETLNTSIRGSTRPFPRLAVIVTETDFTIIYDGTDSTLPMWMVIPVGAYIQYGSLNTSKAKNGVVYNCSNAGVDTGILGQYHMIDDEMYAHNGAGKYYKNTGYRIIDRNTIGTDNVYPGGGDIVNNAMNDIAIASDGNMGNIVGVATDAGVTRIAPDDTTSHWNDESNTVNIVKNIDVNDEYFTWSLDISTAQKYTMMQSFNHTLVNIRYYESVYNHYTSNAGVSWNSGRLPCHFGGVNLDVADRLAAFAGTGWGITKFYDNPSNWGRSMIAHIADDFNSGVQVGDIRGSWLASTDSTSMTDVEHLTDPTFDTACGVNWTCDAGWTISAGSASHTGAADYILSEADILTVDDSYLVTVVVSSVIAGTLTLANMQKDNSNIYITITGAGTYTAFIPRSRVSALRMHTEHDLILDSVSVVQTDQDRSYKNNNITTYGTMDKSPVATGAELMGYNPLSSFGLFVQPHNTDLDFGTGDFFYNIWVKTNIHLETRILWHKHSVIAGAGYGVEIRMEGATGKLDCRAASSTATTPIFSKEPFQIGPWAMISCIRRSGMLLFYLNNELQGSVSNAGDVTNALASLNVGALYDDVDTYSQYWDGQMALLRIGATAPTNEQLTTIYEEEKPMFQENAECTLKTFTGTEAVDYDHTTDIVTVCTFDHITKFKGLVVVDDRTEAATSISTVKEMEMTGV